LSLVRLDRQDGYHNNITTSKVITYPMFIDFISWAIEAKPFDQHVLIVIRIKYPPITPFVGKILTSYNFEVN